MRKTVRAESTLIALQHLDLGMRGLCAYIDRIKAEPNGELFLQQIVEITDKSQGTERDPSLHQLRVIVYENPFAKKRLPEELFRGEYDERYGPLNGKLPRLFAGRGILELEAEEAHSGGGTSPAFPSRQHPRQENHSTGEDR